MKNKNGIWYVFKWQELLGWEVLADSDEGDGFITLKIRHKSTMEERKVKAKPIIVPAGSLERTQGRR